MSASDSEAVFDTCYYDLCNVDNIDIAYCSVAEYLSARCQQELQITVKPWREGECGKYQQDLSFVLKSNSVW